MIKPTDSPVEWAAVVAQLPAATIAMLINFGFLQWDADQVSSFNFWIGLILQLLLLLFLRRYTTSRAKPTAADGTELVPTNQPRTRGIEKG